MRRKRYASSRRAASALSMYPDDDSACRASSVFGLRTDSSWRPCTSWRSCTANSMSRMPPRPRFELAVGEPFALGEVLRAPLHRADLAHRVGTQHVGPHERPRQLHEAFAELGVARDGTGLEQRLELPRLGPPLVVRRVAVDGARQRTAAALGSQVGIGSEHDPVFAWVSPMIAEHRPRATCSALRTVAVVHEEHVDVARVVELASAELSHPDDREAVPSLPASASATSRHTCASAASSRPTAGRSATPSRSRGGDAEQLAPLPPTQPALVGGSRRRPRSR